MSNTYRIISKTGGNSFGEYVADSPEDAFAAMIAEGGDAEDTDGNSAVGTMADWIIEEVEEWEAWMDGDRDGAARFFAPVAGPFDIAEAGAKALGVDVCAELNVARC